MGRIGAQQHVSATVKERAKALQLLGAERLRRISDDKHGHIFGDIGGQAHAHRVETIVDQRMTEPGPGGENAIGLVGHGCDAPFSVSGAEPNTHG